MSLWVLGTDTEVGKTVVSSLILARYGRELPLAYWKPVSTGGHVDRDLATVRGRLDDSVLFLPELHLYDPPVSPHLAARLAGSRIEPDEIVETLERHLREQADRALVVEAAGGVLVPLNDEGALTIDVVARSRLPAVVVARSTLGTINHTLLTLEALRAREVPVLGVVLNGPQNPENLRAIRDFGHVEIIAEVSELGEDRSPTPAEIRAAARDFDSRELLAPALTAPDSAPPPS